MDNIKVGKGTRISSFCKLKSRRGPLVIGSNVDVAVGCFLSSSEKNLVIGNDVSIGPNCSILSNSYNFGDVNTLIREQGRETKGTVIGNNIFIGSGSVILDGSDIGDGCVISANSVVSGRIPRNSIVAGNPAKIIFTRR